MKGRINKQKLALFYHKLGFNIVPARGKIPVFSWKKYQVKRVSEEEVKKWFGNGLNEDLNVACVLGKVSNLVVIDVDKPDIPDWLKRIETWTAKTGKGYHFYFKIDTDQVVKPEKIEDKVELKAEGSIVILPGSKHPNGSIYKWLRFIKHQKEPAPFSSILPVLKEKKQKGSFNNLKPLKTLYQGVPEGERNVSLTRIAGSLYADGLTPYEVYQVLQVINSRNNPPLPEKEVKTIVKSIWKRRSKANSFKNFVLKTLKNAIERSKERGTLIKLAETIAEKLENLTEDPYEKEALLRDAGRDLLINLCGIIKKFEK